MNWAPGGRAPTSDTATEPSARRNHSMWLKPGRAGRGRAAASAPARRIGVVLRAVDVAGQQHAPLDPRMLEHVERRRQVAADRVPHAARRATHDAVEGVLVADDELLDQRRLPRERRRDGQPLPELVRPTRARNVPRAPAPAGGLTTTGKPHRSATAHASSTLRARPWRAHGTPAARSTSFMRALSRKLAARRRRPSRRCRAARAPGPAAPGGSRGCSRPDRPNRAGRPLRRTPSAS